MPRKSLSYQIHGIPSLLLAFATIFSASPLLRSAENTGTEQAHDLEAPKYLGATSCSSSGCHGGGGKNQNQFLLWSTRDFHAQRAFATLTTARSKQIAAALQSADPTSDARCTSCHAPLSNVAPQQRGPAFKVSESVSCESCHGPSERWLRSHTRPDYTHAERVASGMRDLKNLYVRANSCVACHQNVALPLLAAGHPELIFELDGQCASEPRHWREKTNWHGAQAWLVGQAAALREMSWQLATSIHHERDEKLAARADALLWLLQKLEGVTSGAAQLPNLPGAGPERPDYSAVQSSADELARSAAGLDWSTNLTSSLLLVLARSGADFRVEMPRPLQARRAERLVLALDRLLASTGGPSADVALNELFKLAQSRPDFDPALFAKNLDAFSRTLER